MLKNIITFLLFFTLFNSCKQENKIIIDGELKKWHRITLNFEGSETNELAEDNPFLNYRLDVTFKNKDNVFVIPGFYSADGNAPENLLAYSDFDVSTNALGFQKQWQPHAKDFEETATPFLWQEGKVKTF